MHNVHLNTGDRALRSGKSTKQNVLALYIQSLMNTTLVLIQNNNTKNLYEGGLEPGTSKIFDKSYITRLLKNTSKQFKCIYLFTAVKTLRINYIVLLIFI